MQRRWGAYSLLVVVVLLTAATTVALIHWHQNGRDRGCELCHVRQLPSLYAPLVNPLVAPAAQERTPRIADVLFKSSECTPLRLGRAPPECFFS